MNIAKVTNNFMRVRLTPTITDVYGQALIRNKEKLFKLILEKSNRVMQSELAQKMRVAKRYYTLEMRPPSTNELQALREDISTVKEFLDTGCYKYLTVRQAWLLFLVCTEVGLWFFMGETIGKMHFVGYKV